MTALEFTKKTIKKQVYWEAEISAVSGTILVDLERTSIGGVSVSGKLTGTTDYKPMGNVAMAFNSPGVMFQISNDADNATMDVKITCYTEDEPTGNYA